MSLPESWVRWVYQKESGCELRPEATGIQTDALLGKANRLGQTGVEPRAREGKASLDQMPTAVALRLEGWQRRDKKGCSEGSREQDDHHHHP